MLVRREVREAIQEGEHDSVDDARAALLVYRKHRAEWEKWIGERRKGKKEEVVSGEGTVSCCVCLYGCVIVMTGDYNNSCQQSIINQTHTNSTAIPLHKHCTISLSTLTCLLVKQYFLQIHGF